MHRTHVASTISRRHFILTATSAAGGFVIGIAAKPLAVHAATVPVQPWSDGYAANDIDAWIAIYPDDSILIRYQRSEMGQGSMTALPMMIAEELQCDWSKVRIEYASSSRNVRENRVYGNMYSHGSLSVRESQKMVQQVGARHAGIGLDYMDAESMARYFREHATLYRGGDQYPTDGYIDFAPPSVLPEIAEELFRRGYSEDECRAILGGNYLRVLEHNRPNS